MAEINMKRELFTTDFEWMTMETYLNESGILGQTIHKKYLEAEELSESTCWCEKKSTDE